MYDASVIRRIKPLNMWANVYNRSRRLEILYEMLIGVLPDDTNWDLSYIARAFA